MNHLQQWWQNLSEREQTLIQIFGGLLSVFILYFLIWLPVTSQFNSLVSRVKTQKEMHLWLQQKAAIINKISEANISPPVPLVVSSFSVIVNKTMTMNHLSQTGAALQNADNSITVSFKEVSFDHFIQWLSILWQQYQIKVVTLKVTATTMPGAVAATVTLKDL